MRISDWSSDVCSSDLPSERAIGKFIARRADGLAVERGAHDLPSPAFFAEPGRIGGEDVGEENFVPVALTPNGRDRPNPYDFGFHIEHEDVDHSRVAAFVRDARAEETIVRRMGGGGTYHRNVY